MEVAQAPPHPSQLTETSSTCVASLYSLLTDGHCKWALAIACQVVTFMRCRCVVCAAGPNSRQCPSTKLLLMEVVAMLHLYLLLHPISHNGHFWRHDKDGWHPTHAKHPLSKGISAPPPLAEHVSNVATPPPPCASTAAVPKKPGKTAVQRPCRA